MREAAKDWLQRAEWDLRACEKLLDAPDLRSIVAFHAQQCVEKLFKCLLENEHQRIPRTHDLVRLHYQVVDYLPVPVETEMLAELSTVYLDTRYPSDLGLMPDGMPQETDIRRYVSLASTLFESISSCARNS